MVVRVGVASLAVALLGATAAGVGTATSSPSRGRCAGAWNRTATSSTREAIARTGTHEATVNGVLATRLSLGHAPATVEAACVIDFFVGQGRLLVLRGGWNGKTVAVWSSPLPVRTSSTAGSGNACVASDGTIHQVGAFDAATRCS